MNGFGGVRLGRADSQFGVDGPRPGIEEIKDERDDNGV